MPIIFLRQLLKAEFVRACHLPQKIRVEFLRQRLCCLHHLGRGRRGKAQQNSRRFDFAAFTGRGFNLRGSVGFRQNRPGLEMAVFFKN